MSYSRAVQPDRRDAGAAGPSVMTEPPGRPLRRGRRAAECSSLWKMDEMSRKFQGRREHLVKKFGDGLSVPEGTYHPLDASSMGRLVHGTHRPGTVAG
jgi:hypothetical protein